MKTNKIKYNRNTINITKYTVITILPLAIVIFLLHLFLHWEKKTKQNFYCRLKFKQSGKPNVLFMPKMGLVQWIVSNKKGSVSITSTGWCVVKKQQHCYINSWLVKFSDRGFFPPPVLHTDSKALVHYLFNLFYKNAWLCHNSACLTICPALLCDLIDCTSPLVPVCQSRSASASPSSSSALGLLAQQWQHSSGRASPLPSLGSSDTARDSLWTLSLG